MNISLAKPRCYKRFMWDLQKINEENLVNAIICIHWDDIFVDVDVDDVDALYNRWLVCFRLILETYVPNSIVVVRPRDKPWMNSEIRRAVRKRNRLLKIFCQNRVPENWEVYRFQNFTTSLIRRRKRSYYNNLNNKLQDPLLG